MRLLGLILCLCLPASLSAETSADRARAAAQALEDASRMLDKADGARDRVRALTETIRAFEVGLGAMRTGMREAAIQEASLSAVLEARDEEIAQLLGVLQGIGATNSPTILLHPLGPEGTARAGMLLAELTPALNARVESLRADLEALQTLQTLQDDAAARLQAALDQVQAARLALNQAMAERTDLPRRFTEDAEGTRLLIASSETLDGFASGLSQIVMSELAPAPTRLEDEIGSLPLPAQGLILRRPGEADAAGVKRPGLILATRPGALVTAPTAATIRFTGPLLDYGEVVILEPAVDTLIILTGLSLAYGDAGQVIAAGTPVGLMGGAAGTSDERLSPLREGTGTERSETLYIEVRTDNTPRDPLTWFRTDEDN